MSHDLKENNKKFSLLALSVLVHERNVSFACHYKYGDYMCSPFVHFQCNMRHSYPDRFLHIFFQFDHIALEYYFRRFETICRSLN